MSQAVSRWPVTAEARFLSQDSPCGIWCGFYGTGTGVVITPLQCTPLHFFIHSSPTLQSKLWICFTHEGQGGHQATRSWTGESRPDQLQTPKLYLY
jgi:hypothetical protein